jgi:hypothetical protein
MSQNAVRNYSYKELIGCNKTELLEHLKTSNKTNLSIELYPELEVDHIFPISKFNLKNIDEQKRCSQFTSYIKT